MADATERSQAASSPEGNDLSSAGAGRLASPSSRPATGLDGAPSRPGRQLIVWLPLAIIVLDQITKALIRLMLPLHDSVTIIPGVLDFTHVRNTGAAFGLLNTAIFPTRPRSSPVVATIALVAIAYYATTLAPREVLTRIGLALIVGGAAGNLIDRLALGSVVDFVDVYWRSYHFWAFNVADSAITVGVAAMLLDMLGVRTHVSHPV